MAARLQPGSNFAGDYRVVQLLGEGGMGAVYVVEQRSTSARRALKLMLPHLAADERARERFEREAKVGASIPSDHIVHVIGAGFDEATGSPWIAMELLDGESLDARVRRTGPLSTSEARDLFAQLGHALHAAHGVDVVHRDLKPENLHIGRGHREGDRMLLKVLDFGIAKLVSEVAESATAPVGTLAWMAPEQTSHAGISAATDVWAVGLIAFWAFTGKSYWRALHTGEATMGQLMRELLIDPLPAPSDRARELGAPALPPGFEEWFARAVVRDPKQRFREGGEACDALVALLRTGSDAPILAYAPTSPVEPLSGDLLASVSATALAPSQSAALPSAPPRAGRGRAAAIGVAAFVIVTASAAALLVWRRGDPPRAASSTVASASASAAASSAPAPHTPIFPCLGTVRTFPKVEERRTCADDGVPWCTQTGHMMACCAKGLVPEGDEGACGCPRAQAEKPEDRNPMCPPAPSLEPGAIRAVVRAHVGEMGKACYEPMLKRFPEAEGKVAIKFEIDPNGDIFFARIEQGMLADATAQKCILDVFRALHFPPPNGGSMDVIYPIMFKPGG